MTTFPSEEHAVVEGWSTVEATGPDAGKFLQSFCTNDVLKLADGDSCEAMFTDVKAHVIAYTWVARRAEDAYTVLLGSDRAGALATHLDRYLIREQVELSTRTSLAVAIGPSAGDFPLAAFGPTVSAHLDSQTHAAGGGSPLTAEEFTRLRIQLGVPLDGVDVDERNLPQEVDRNDQAISFTKGCYLGQEPVARIDALGRVNWLLRRLEIDGAAPERNTELTLDGKAVGRITSAIGNDTGSIALGYVRREQAESNSRLTCDERTVTISRCD